MEEGKKRLFPKGKRIIYNIQLLRIFKLKSVSSWSHRRRRDELKKKKNTDWTKNLPVGRVRRKKKKKGKKKKKRSYFP